MTIAIVYQCSNLVQSLIQDCYKCMSVSVTERRVAPHLCHMKIVKLIGKLTINSEQKTANLYVIVVCGSTKLKHFPKWVMQ